MILDRTWNKKEQKLTISYIDKQGNRQFYQKYLHHIKTYEYDENGEFETWNRKRCNKVFKDTSVYTPNEFDLLEFMYELPKDLNDLLHAQYFPRLYFYDIETEISDEFPDPKIAKQMITSISVVGPDMSCIVYGLKQMNNDQIELLRKRYLDWINNNDFARNRLKDKTPKVLYQYFESESDMIKHFFTRIIPKVTAIAAWNGLRFDWMYLWNRLINLFGRGEAYNILRKSSPTGEIGQLSYTEVDGTTERIPCPLHVAILDYMELVKKYDYILRPYESYSLDWVASAAIKAHKIKYEGTLQDLYEKDTEWYYFYNAIDSLIGLLIHYRLKSLESPCSVSAVTLVSLQNSMGQIALTTANVFEEFYKDNKKVVYDWDEIDRARFPYEGAFCAAVPGRYGLCVCDDFASLYPSQVMTCNFSFENIVTNIVGPDSLGRYTPIDWTEDELNKFREDPNYFVSVNGNVYRNDRDYAFRRLQRKLKAGRAVYKYTGQKIEAELLTEIDRLINEKIKEKENKES